MCVLSVFFMHSFWVKMAHLTFPFYTNLKIYPTEEDVDVDDVLVEDAEVILLLWLSLSDYTDFSFCDNASF